MGRTTRGKRRSSKTVTAEDALRAEIEALEAELSGMVTSQDDELDMDENEDLMDEADVLEEDFEEEDFDDEDLEDGDMVEDDLADIEEELRAMEQEIRRSDDDEDEEEDEDEDDDEEVEVEEEVSARKSEDDEVDIPDYEEEIDDYDDELAEEEEVDEYEEELTEEEIDPSQNARKSLEEEIRLLEAAIDNPEDERGLWQDHSGVEDLMGVKDLAESGKDGDMLPTVDEQTEVDEGDMIYASRLKEASSRLDRVASALEKRGGKWVKFAYRVDQMADAVDTKRKGIMTKLASARIASRKNKRS